MLCIVCAISFYNKYTLYKKVSSFSNDMPWMTIKIWGHSARYCLDTTSAVSSLIGLQNETNNQANLLPESSSDSVNDVSSFFKKPWDWELRRTKSQVVRNQTKRQFITTKSHVSARIYREWLWKVVDTLQGIFRHNECRLTSNRSSKWDRQSRQNL